MLHHVHMCCQCAWVKTRAQPLIIVKCTFQVMHVCGEQVAAGGVVTSDRKLGAALQDLTLAHDVGWGTPAGLLSAMLQAAAWT